MPTTCLIVGCGSRSNRDNVRFFAVPTVLHNKFLLEKNELSEKRRNMWIAAIRRDFLSDTILKNQKVCSKHFITGKPATLEDVNHTDWVPSQHLGHQSKISQQKPEDVERLSRAKKRKQSTTIREDIAESGLDVEEDVLEEERDTGVSSQTDLTIETLATKFSQLDFAAEKIALLTQKLLVSPLGLLDRKYDNDMWVYYTGFTYEFIHIMVFPGIEEEISMRSVSALSKFNKLLITLIKLRLDLDFKDLAYCFNISPTTASTYFEHIINLLYYKYKPFIIWPDREQAQKNIPLCFKKVFHDKATVIVDCTEVFIEKPSSLLTQQQCWSNYKHNYTIKFLIGITPQGSVSFISEAWGGRASDKHILEKSTFCNNIIPGDVVLADRGFLIKETLGILQAKLVVPAYTKRKNQLHPLEIEETRHLAHVRIHVETIIGALKNKFNIIHGTIPITMLKKNYEHENVNLLDKIIVVCCSLINMAPPIIPL